MYGTDAMRKVLLFLLLTTTAATSSFAQRNDDDRNSRREKREETRDERRAAPAEGARRTPRAQRQADVGPDGPNALRRTVRVERDEPRQRQVEGRIATPEDQVPAVRARQGDAARAGIREWKGERGQRQAENADGQRSSGQIRSREVRPDSVREWRSGERERLRAARVQGRRDPVAVPAGARPDRPAPPPRVSTAHYRSSPWRSSWRNDSRYDWRRHRDRNRWRFNLGFYFDPFGWNYRRYPIGWRLWPSYYGQSYWLDDPWMYHLPPAYGPYRWVRYYNDALLVNIYTGQVEDVIYSFFW